MLHSRASANEGVRNSLVLNSNLFQVMKNLSSEDESRGNFLLYWFTLRRLYVIGKVSKDDPDRPQARNVPLRRFQLLQVWRQRTTPVSSTKICSLCEPSFLTSKSIRKSVVYCKTFSDDGIKAVLTKREPWWAVDVVSITPTYCLLGFVMKLYEHWTYIRSNKSEFLLYNSWQENRNPLSFLQSPFCCVA